MHALTRKSKPCSLETMAHHAKKMKNDELKIHDTFSPGDVTAQGDLNIVCLPKMPSSAKRRKNLQLADGNTQGSRHVLTQGLAYECDKSELRNAIKIATGCDVAEMCLGPVFTGDHNPSYVSHPEHGDQQFPADSICVVTYQRSLDAEERERLAAD